MVYKFTEGLCIIQEILMLYKSYSKANSLFYISSFNLWLRGMCKIGIVKLLRTNVINRKISVDQKFIWIFLYYVRIESGIQINY